jgi:hypothetical protein
MRLKTLLSLLPVAAIAIVGWLYLSLQWQQSQAKRPVYDVRVDTGGS